MAAATGLPTTLTDLQEVLPALQRNVEANPQVKTVAVTLVIAY